MSVHDDLRGAFSLLEERAPTTCDLPDGGQDAPRHRFRFALPLAAVAAVAAVAVMVPLALRHTGATSPADTHPAGSSPIGSHPAAVSTPPVHPVNLGDALRKPGAGQSTRLVTDLTLGPVTGYTASPVEATRLYQHVSVGVDALLGNQDQGVAGGGDLYGFYVGGQVPSEALHGQRVDVNGHQGFIGQAYQPTPQGVRDGDARTDSIAWQYAPRGWALITMDASVFTATHTDEATELLKLARAVRIAPSVPLKVPFRMTYVPPGQYVDGAQYNTGKPLVGQIGFGDGTPGSREDSPAKHQLGSSLIVTVYVHAPQIDCSQGHPVQVKGGSGCAYSMNGGAFEITAIVDGHRITVSVDDAHIGRYSADDLQQMLEGVTVVPNADRPSSWVDATSALPH